MKTALVFPFHKEEIDVQRIKWFTQNPRTSKWQSQMQDTGFQTTHPLVVTSPGDQSLLKWIKHSSTLVRMWLVILQSPAWLARSSSSATHARWILCPHPFSCPSSCWVQGAGLRGGLCFCPGLEGQAHSDGDQMAGRKGHTPRGDCGSHVGPSGSSSQFVHPSKSVTSSNLPPHRRCTPKS